MQECYDCGLGDSCNLVRREVGGRGKVGGRLAVLSIHHRRLHLRSTSRTLNSLADRDGQADKCRG